MVLMICCVLLVVYAMFNLLIALDVDYFGHYCFWWLLLCIGTFVVVGYSYLVLTYFVILLD